MHSLGCDAIAPPRSHHCSCTTHAYSQVVARQAEIARMGEIVGETHRSLEADRQKALLLVRNFAPELADELEQEFAVPG